MRRERGKQLLSWLVTLDFCHEQNDLRAQIKKERNTRR